MRTRRKMLELAASLMGRLIECARTHDPALYAEMREAMTDPEVAAFATAVALELELGGGRREEPEEPIH